MINAHHSDDPYKILELDRGATEAEIKQAYFAQVREHSPESDPEGFKRIRAAYEKLRSGGERAETDLFLVDDRDARLDPARLQQTPTEPAPVTVELIKQDLFALEAALLLEELSVAE